ncbi:hypothetical protein ABIB54_001377 [Frigoribacterium sp. UYMn621]
MRLECCRSAAGSMQIRRAVRCHPEPLRWPLECRLSAASTARSSAGRLPWRWPLRCPLECRSTAENRVLCRRTSVTVLRHNSTLNRVGTKRGSTASPVATTPESNTPPPAHSIESGPNAGKQPPRSQQPPSRILRHRHTQSSRDQTRVNSLPGRNNPRVEYSTAAARRPRLPAGGRPHPARPRYGGPAAQPSAAHRTPPHPTPPRPDARP